MYPADELDREPDVEPRWRTFLTTAADTGVRQVRGFFSRMLPEPEAPPVDDAPPRPARFVETPTEDVSEEYDEYVEADDESLPPEELQAMRGARRAPAAMPAPEPLDAEPLDEQAVDDYDDESELGTPVPALDMTPFATPQPTRGARGRLFLLAALALLILVPAIVIAMTWVPYNNRRAEAESLTVGAERQLARCQNALDADDKVTAREACTEAQENLSQAIELDGSNDHRNALAWTIESELQEVLQIEPLYGLTEPLITFPSDARPQRVLVMNDSIYILDTGRQAVVQYRFNPATGVVADEVGQMVLRQGDTVDGAVVGALADMAWLPLIPSVEDRPSSAHYRPQ